MAARKKTKNAVVRRSLTLWAALWLAHAGGADAAISALTGPATLVGGNPGGWDAKTLGNHRALVRVAVQADAVWARVPWHRRDAAPQKKAVVVIEERSGRRVPNALPIEVRGAYGDIVFEAQNPGDYGVYFMPYSLQGTSYPQAKYHAPTNSADPAWLARNRLDGDAKLLLEKDALPRAAFVALQAIDDFNAFTPMESAASMEETAHLLAAHPDKPFLLFPEDRTRPIRMTDHLPLHWVEEGPRPVFAGEVARGEFYAFQLGLYAATADLSGIAVTFSDLAGDNSGGTILASALRCFNLGGVNWDGAALTKTVSVAKGTVQPLWCGVQIPRDAKAQTYRGTVHVKAAGVVEQKVELALTVTRQELANSGDDEPWRQSRLRWLDSTLDLDDGLVRPFTPIRATNETLDILGRRMTLEPSGLPASIISFFSPEVTGIEETPRPLLAAPMILTGEDATGQRLRWKPDPAPAIVRKDGIATWKGSSKAGPLVMEVSGSLEFDGFARFKVTVSAGSEAEFRDLRLEIPLLAKAVPYLMGLGRKGGFRPVTLDWTWGKEKNQDSLWLGDASVGLQIKLKGENYERPLLTNFYQDQPLNMPPAWFNGGRGGISIRSGEAAVIVTCFGGPRTLKAGEKLHFDFELLLTPFRPINPQAQWSTRYFHHYEPPDAVLRTGANVVNVHHANEANPYINYPFLHTAELKSYVNEAHGKGLKVKIYDTIRELSNHAAELFALRSLGAEVFAKGSGGGSPWLQEHFGGSYIPAWCVPKWQDAAIINKGSSRWANYYIQGLDWLVRNAAIDGLYLDDLAFDRTTMKRIRKVLDRSRAGSLIDFHSANLFNPRDGFGNSANVYLEHLPYVDRLWFGEYFDPNSPPEFWLIEMSGIPYGLMGEMLQDGGNRWRGMLYGMTARLPYDGNDPSPIWKVWDDFKIQESRMYGYWSPRCPVKTDRKEVLATVYAGQGRSLIALASWGAEDTPIGLTLDWPALGIDPAKARLTAPPIRDYQAAATFDPATPIPVPRGKGWLLMLETRE